MKKIFFGLSVGFGLFIQSVSASVVAKAGTWQMMGYRMDVNLSKVANLDVDKFSIIWHWDNGSWRAFSKDPTVLSAINRLGLFGDIVKHDQGFWIKAKRDFKILPYEPEVSLIPKTRGWHLVSLKDKSIHSSQLPPSVNVAFFYRDGDWKYIRKLSNGTIQASNNYLTNYGNEGFWVYNGTENTDNYPIYGYYKPKNCDTFSNKTFSFNNKNITLDQNGSVISNIPEINGGKWMGFEYSDWRIGFGIKKGDKKYFYNASKVPDRGYNLSQITTVTFKTLPNGIEETLDVNHTDYGSQNVALNVTEYNRSKVLDTDVKNALDTLKNIADFGDSDARAKLNNIKDSLSTSDSKDAKVVLALINFIEILDTDIVKNSFLANTQRLDINSFASTIIPDENATIKLAESISDYEGNAKVLMQDLSDRLKTNADNLKNLGLDENYYLQYDDVKLNFVDIKELRLAMLALSFKLQFLTSYQLGNDEWLKSTTETIDNMSVEYIKAAADPVAFLNSGTFLVNPDQAKLTKAKSIFREFLGSYYEFLNSDNYAREGMNISGSKLNDRNLKRDIKLAINNLDGKRDGLYILDDSYDWEHKTHEYYKGVFDLNALFDATKTITIADFGTFSYSEYKGVYDEEKSKIENTPTSSSGWDLSDEIEASQNFTAPNHINNIFKSYKERGVLYTGVDLLNEIFGTN